MSDADPRTTGSAYRDMPDVLGATERESAAIDAYGRWRDRARNVRGAFVARPDVAGRSVAIVDDVMTTGASVAAAAMAARRAGAVRVEAWVAARTLPPS